ncbi:MAG TPA: DUF6141 family protein [Pyrinomonadaceae bacterium]|jgi:hypothetical protein|nr:DUF6141 family protein [Pyrinomonadaceae bacterium]
MSQRVNRTYFREVQRFRQWWVWAIMLVPFLIFAYGFYVQVIAGRPWGSKPMSDAELTGVSIMLAVIMLWIYLMRLVTEVRDDALHVHFVLLWRRKAIPYQSIRSVEARTYNPIAEYGGWGIRWGARGWAYNVSGNRGVQLQLDGGKELLVGSGRADELAEAIKRRTEASHS